MPSAFCFAQSVPTGQRIERAWAGRNIIDPASFMNDEAIYGMTFQRAANNLFFRAI
jgi:hypothetical protein